ncbi:TIGR04211 family SH3 domain-containing protein [Algibacillus agarilyticus]|uniref:TIGR04211 family SH3 domain-containing protein n=1 Tax=Algibacillus agarilyticus TaxID=2234133 RepID=UPI001300AF29|nr:TIGR04211 family SH3 domain-containing protein [Algibacillus agarilyticus]
MFRHILLISTLMLANPLSAEEENTTPESPAYVTDDLSIFLHTGSSRNYRIQGSVTAGSLISILDNNPETEFTQIEDDKGRVGWVESKYLTQTSGVRQALTSAEATILSQTAELEALTQRVAELTENNNQYEQQLNEFKSSVADLTSNLNAKNQEIAKLTELSDNKATREQLQWLMKGGGVLFFGLLIGYIMAFMPKRKKRNDFGYGDL